MKTPNARPCRPTQAVAPGTWCWQDTTARHLIRSRRLGASKTSKAVVLSVYDALTEKAAAESSSGFVAFQHELATMAGCSVAVLKLALSQLVAAHLVRVNTTPNHGPNMYCLLAPPNHPSVSHDVANVRRKPKAVRPIASTGTLARISRLQSHTSSGSVPDLEPSPSNGTVEIPPATPLGTAAQMGHAYVRTTDPVRLTQTVASPAPSQALQDFRQMLAKGTFRTPTGRIVAQRLIVMLTPGDLAMLTPEEEAKAKALRGGR